MSKLFYKNLIILQRWFCFMLDILRLELVMTIAKGLQKSLELKFGKLWVKILSY